MTSYSRQDVLRILEISTHQLLGWERAGLIFQQQTYSFQDLGQLRTLRALREESVSAAAIRQSVVAMKAVAGVANPLLEASCVARTGTRLAFRHMGAMVDPIRRQLLFDFARWERLEPVDKRLAAADAMPRRKGGDPRQRGVQERFLAAVQAEENGEKQSAIRIYEEILKLDPEYAPAYINLGTLHFHLREFDRAEQLYRRATEADPGYVLAFFDLGNVLDELQRQEESVVAYRRAIALAPHFADAHYNLALACERMGKRRQSLRHWQTYLRLDNRGPWADHARGQIRKHLVQEKLTIAARAAGYLAPAKGQARLSVVHPSEQR